MFHVNVDWKKRLSMSLGTLFLNTATNALNLLVGSDNDGTSSTTNISTSDFSDDSVDVDQSRDQQRSTDPQSKKSSHDPKKATNADSREPLYVPKDIQLKAADLLKMLKVPKVPTPEIKPSKSVCIQSRRQILTKTSSTAVKPSATALIGKSKLTNSGPDPFREPSRPPSIAFLADKPKVGKSAEEKRVLRKKILQKLPPVTTQSLPSIERVEDKADMSSRSRREVPSWILDVLDDSCDSDSQRTLQRLSMGEMDMHDLHKLKKKRNKKSRSKMKNMKI